MEKLKQKSASFHTSSVGMKRKIILYGGNNEKIKSLLNQLETMFNTNSNNNKMKEIKLIDGIPSTALQSLNDSILEILKGWDKKNTSEICSLILNENIEIEIKKNKLIEELFPAFKYTLVNNKYGDLLSNEEMLNVVTDYVNKYILIKK